MVWFQCEDCGENLKKPKLQNHFYRCSAHKLSCIDCGVIFDQQSVQAHTSCVTETEKYGPKSTNRSVSGSLPSKPNEKQVDPTVNFSLGLSTSAPWSCSLCNVDTTSRETLELHSQGKKHCKKVRAAASASKKVVAAAQIDERNGVDLLSATEGTSRVGAGVVSEETPAKPAENVALNVIGSLPVEKKRKKATHDVGAVAACLVSVEPVQSQKDDKKLRRTEVTGAVKAGEDLAGGVCPSPEKKRKHAEELQKPSLGVAEAHKHDRKSRKKGKHESRDEVLRDANPEIHAKVGEEIDTVGGGKMEISDLLRIKDKKRHLKHWSESHSTDQPTSEENGLAARADGIPLRPPMTGAMDLGTIIADGKLKTGKKSKKLRRILDADNGIVTLETRDSEIVNGGAKSGKKEKSNKIEEKQNFVHEVSFRAWLGDENGNGVDGKVLSQPSGDATAIGNGNSLRNADVGVEVRRSDDSNSLDGAGKESTQVKIAKVVKWKRIIREVLAKSVNGRLKQKELTRAVLPLAQKAMGSSALSVDRKALKAELMRQVSSSPKFVMDGKHVMLSSKAK